MVRASDTSCSNLNLKIPYLKIIQMCKGGGGGGGGIILSDERLFQTGNLIFVEIRPTSRGEMSDRDSRLFLTII